jgi:hypothetical protein
LDVKTTTTITATRRAFGRYTHNNNNNNNTVAPVWLPPSISEFCSGGDAVEMAAKSGVVSEVAANVEGGESSAMSDWWQSGDNQRRDNSQLAAGGSMNLTTPL